jgi:hypothetical protein
MRGANVPMRLVHDDTALWSGGADAQLHLVAGVAMQLSIVGRSVASPQVSPVAASTPGSTSSTLSLEKASTSGPSELFRKLEALATSDPEKFKQVTSELAAAVKDAADAATDPREQQLLADLAAKFTEASQSGDASVLKPPEGPPPGPPPGGPPPKAASGPGDATAAGAASTKQYAPADANQDGTVTVQEQAVYDAAHPSRAEQAYAATMDQARQGRAEALFSTLQRVVASAG